MNRNDTNVNTGGGSITGAAIGSGNTVSGNDIRIVEGSNSAEKLSQAELVKALKNLHVELGKVKDISPDSASEIDEDMAAAISATEKQKPNKSRALEKLKSVQSILGTIGTSASAIALGKLVGNAISKIASSL